MTLDPRGDVGQAGPGLFSVGWWKAATVAATPAPQPTVVHSKNAVLKLAINGSMTNVSSYFRVAGMHKEAAPIFTSSITSPTKSCIPGPSETKLPIEGFYDPTIAQSLEAIRASQPTTFEYYPAGTATGSYMFSGTAVLNQHNTESPISNANQISGELTMSGSPRFATI